MKKRLVALSAMSTMAIALAGIAYSEEKKPAITPAIMDEVVVSATKTLEKRKDISNSVVLLAAEEIAERPAATVGVLLANEPGLDWRTNGNYGGAAEELRIRGMSGNATQVTVNGVAYNSPSLGVADISKFPLNNIDHIEVVKGAGSLLYGSGAVGGTINILTRRPDRDRMELEATAGYGSQGTYQVSAKQGMFVLGDFGYYLTAGRKETDGFRANSDLEHNDVSINLLLDKGKSLQVTLYGDYVDRKFGIPGVKPPEGTPAFAINGVTFYNSEAADLLNRGSDRDSHAVLAIKSSPLTWLDLNANTSISELHNLYKARYVTSPTSSAGYQSKTVNKVLAAEAGLNVKPFGGAGLLLGGEYKDFNWRNETVDLNTAGSELPATNKSAEADLYSHGLYGEVQYRPFAYGKIISGIRLEKHSTFGSETLPLFGLVVNPLDGTALKVSHGKHFLAPTPNDLFWPADLYTKGNPNLKPETGWHSDLTLEQSLLANRLFINISCFKWDVRNKIQWDYDSLTFMYSPTNLDSYKANGIEAGLKLGPFMNTSLGLDYTYTKAEEENQFVTRRAAYSARDSFKTNLTSWFDFGLTASLTARYVGRRLYYGTDKTTAIPSHVLESYWTTDIKLEQRLFEHATLTLTVDNVFDKGYITYVGSFFDENFNQIWGTFPGAGRSVFFSAGYTF